jgi:hypothetical protein
VEARNTTVPLLVSAVVFIAVLNVGGVIDPRLSLHTPPARISLPAQSSTRPVDLEQSTSEVAATEMADQNDDLDSGSSAGVDAEDAEAEDPACLGAEGADRGSEDASHRPA